MNRYYLYHHGILGQKWGQRNGPPYPLGASDHSASERKADWRSSLDKSSQSETKKQKQKKSQVKTDRKAGDLSDYADLAGQLLSVALTFSYSGYLKHSMNKRYKKEIENNKKNNTTNIRKRIKTKHTPEQDSEVINPGYKQRNDVSTHMNCAMCTTAYEMRRRGYDVKANTTKLGRYNETIESYWNLPKGSFKKSKTYNELKDKLQKEPDGSRGNITSDVGMYNSRHSMVWEKNNGKVTIRDCQSNIFYDSIDSSIISKTPTRTYDYIRTDNIPDSKINWDNMRDCIVEN